MSSEATDKPIIKNEVAKVDSSNTNTLAELTDQNWLFIKHFLETSDVRTAYSRAGYTGKVQSAPYELFRRLKPAIEEMVNAQLTSKIKFSDDLNKALSIPLIDKEHLTVSEWLRLRKFAASLIPEVANNKQTLSVLVVNRFDNQEEADKHNSGLGTKPTHQPSNKDVIEATIIPPSNE